MIDPPHLINYILTLFWVAIFYPYSWRGWANFLTSNPPKWSILCLNRELSRTNSEFFQPNEFYPQDFADDTTLLAPQVKTGTESEKILKNIDTP